MAAAQSHIKWKDLPDDILLAIDKHLTTDVEHLRLRSVCSSWRSSVPPPPPKKFSLPLKLPLLRPNGKHNSKGGFCTLIENTYYRLSPPAIGSHAGDPSKGWLFKVSEETPNSYSIQDALLMDRLKYCPKAIPKQFNLLDYRISEICKSHTLIFSQDSVDECYISRKVVVLVDSVVDCNCVVLVLGYDQSMYYWKFGDGDCSSIITGYNFNDVIVYDKKFYALDATGSLVSFDSEFSMKIVTIPPKRNRAILSNFLVECKSQLYMVSKITPTIDLNWKIPVEEDYDENDTAVPFELKMSKLVSKVSGNRNYVRDFMNRLFCLIMHTDVEDSEDSFIISGSDASFCVSTKDFGGTKGNRVYFNDPYFRDVSMSRDESGVYHLDDGKAFISEKAEDFSKIFFS